MTLYNFDKILKLIKGLYPTGRAFNFTEKSTANAFHKGISEPLKNAYNASLSTLDSLLPDNPNFTALDATDWERRLGMISNDLVSLSDRKLAIARKLAYPGNVKARQHWSYIEYNLRLAGFDVYVYENRFDDGGNIITLDPNDIGGFQHGGFEHGELEHGDLGAVKCVNYISEAMDSAFDIGANYRSTFFIGTTAFGVKDNRGVSTLAFPVADPSSLFAEVPLVRKKEFRALVLKLKPAQSVGLLFVNYV